MSFAPEALPERPAARLVGLLLSVAATAILLGACKEVGSGETGRIDALSRRYLDNYAAIATTLAQVTDADSAEKAVPRIKALQREMKEVGDKMGRLSGDEQRRFSRSFGAEFTKIREKMAAERKRITSMPDVDAVFSAAMQAEPAPTG